MGGGKLLRLRQILLRTSMVALERYHMFSCHQSSIFLALPQKPVTSCFNPDAKPLLASQPLVKKQMPKTTKKSFVTLTFYSLPSFNKD